jgi:hypothetical protein
MSKGIEAAKDIVQSTGNENLVKIRFLLLPMVPLHQSGNDTNNFNWFQVVKILDLASLQSVRQFAQDIIKNEARYNNLKVLKSNSR